MSTSANKVRVVKVALRLPRYQVPLLVTRARLILTKMTANPWFPQANPPLSQLGAAIDDLHQAPVTTLTRVAGSVSARDKKRRDLVSLLERLAVYVETIANANMESAFAIIESAGMFVKNTRGRSPVAFHVEPTGRRGEVRVVAPSAGDRAGYEFQYSLDGGETWLPFPQPFTNHTTDTLPGLTPGSIVLFRYRMTVKGVTGNWSSSVSIKVEPRSRRGPFREVEPHLVERAAPFDARWLLLEDRKVLAGLEQSLLACRILLSRLRRCL